MPKPAVKQQRIRTILLAKPDMKFADAEREYARKFGETIDHSTFYRIKREVKEGRATADEEEAAVPPPPAGEEEAATEPPLPSPVEDSFVSEALLDVIGEIDRAVQMAGGYDNAVHIAHVIDNAGGTANFERAIILLQRIKPPSPREMATRGLGDASPARPLANPA